MFVPRVIAAFVGAFLVCAAFAHGQNAGGAKERSPKPARDAKKAKGRVRSAKDLEKASSLTLQVKNQPLEKVLEFIEKTCGSGARVLKDSFERKPDESYLKSTKVTLQLRDASYWSAVEALAKAAELDVLGVMGRRLEFVRRYFGKTSLPARRLGKALELGPFLLFAEDIDGNVFVRLRAEPWIGLPRLERYALRLGLADGKTLAPPALDKPASLVSTQVEEISIPIDAEILQGQKSLRSLAVELDLAVALAWEDLVLPPFDGILGKPQKVGEGELSIDRIEEGSGPQEGAKSLFIHGRAKGYTVSASAAALVDRKQARLQANLAGQNDGGEFVLTFFIGNSADEVRSGFRLGLTVPASVVQHKLAGELGELTLAP